MRYQPALAFSLIYILTGCDPSPKTSSPSTKREADPQPEAVHQPLSPIHTSKVVGPKELQGDIFIVEKNGGGVKLALVTVYFLEAQQGKKLLEERKLLTEKYSTLAKEREPLVKDHLEKNEELAALKRAAFQIIRPELESLAASPGSAGVKEGYFQLLTSRLTPIDRTNAAGEIQWRQENVEKRCEEISLELKRLEDSSFAGKVRSLFSRIDMAGLSSVDASMLTVRKELDLMQAALELREFDSGVTNAVFTVTDAEGHFRFALKGEQTSFLFARASREVEKTTEYYCWLLPVVMSTDGEKMLLSQHNCLDIPKYYNVRRK